MTISHVSNVSASPPAVPPPVYFRIFSFSLTDIQETYTLDLYITFGNDKNWLISALAKRKEIYREWEILLLIDQLVCCTLFIVLKLVNGNINLNYVPLYIAYLILMVNVVQEHNLRRQNLNKTGDIRITVTLWCGCVTLLAVGK
jgi:hypothetical protein